MLCNVCAVIFKPLSVSKCVRSGRFYLFQSTRVPAVINYGEAQKKGLTLEQRRLLVSSIYIPRLSYFASKEETFCSLYRSKMNTFDVNWTKTRPRSPCQLRVIEVKFGRVRAWNGKIKFICGWRIYGNQEKRYCLRAVPLLSDYFTTHMACILHLKNAQ